MQTPSKGFSFSFLEEDDASITQEDPQKPKPQFQFVDSTFKLTATPLTEIRTRKKSFAKTKLLDEGSTTTAFQPTLVPITQNPSTFDGTGKVTPAEYFEEFSLIARARGWTELYSIYCLPLFLKGSAYRHWKLECIHTTSWTDIVASFILKYAGTADPVSVNSALPGSTPSSAPLHKSTSKDDDYKKDSSKSETHPEIKRDRKERFEAEAKNIATKKSSSSNSSSSSYPEPELENFAVTISNENHGVKRERERKEPQKFTITVPGTGAKEPWCSFCKTGSHHESDCRKSKQLTAKIAKTNSSSTNSSSSSSRPSTTSAPVVTFKPKYDREKELEDRERELREREKELEKRERDLDYGRDRYDYRSDPGSRGDRSRERGRDYDGPSADHSPANGGFMFLE